MLAPRRRLLNPRPAGIVDAVLVTTVFAAGTIQQQFAVGPLHIAFLEFIIALPILYFLYRQFRTTGTVVLSTHSLVLPFLMITIWTMLIRPWEAISTGSLTGFTDIRFWLIPIITLVAILGAYPDHWRRWTMMLVAVGGVTALIAVGQYFLKVTPPFLHRDAGLERMSLSLLFGARSPQQTHFAAAYFAQANPLGQFLCSSLLVSVAWLMGRRDSAVVKMLIVGLLFVALYFTFSKTAIALAAFLVALMIGTWPMKTTSRFVLAAVGLLIVGVTVAALLLTSVPQIFLETLEWRFHLWGYVDNVLLEHPEVLLIGSGLGRFGEIAFYEQPHNAYFYLLLQYGLPGIIFQISLLVLLIHQGLHAHREGHFEREPLLRGLWFALLASFLFGSVESVYESVEPRLLFMTYLACFIGLERQARLAMAKPSVPALRDKSSLGHTRELRLQVRTAHESFPYGH